MKRWELALEKFISRWPQREDAVAAVACGSFVTGNPSPRSDVDLHLVLHPRVTWRERGNRIVDGVMIEYFANPPAQIRAYFSENHADYNQTNATQFVTGRIIFDRRGEAKRLKREAQAWLKKRFVPRAPWRRSLDRYAIYDHYDNLMDALERGAPDANYLYCAWLMLVYDLYARFLLQPVATAKSTLGILTKAAVRRKYCAPPFPDKAFVRLFAAAIAAKGPQQKRHAERLRAHVLRAMGGFEIDGWRIRTPVSAKK
jgi:hypothetical protein